MKVKITVLDVRKQVGAVGPIGKIPAFKLQGPQFDPQLCRELNDCAIFSPPKLTQLSILPGHSY